MNKYRLYLRAFSNVIAARLEDEEDKQLIKQNVFYGIKVMNMKSNATNYEESHSDFEMHSVIKQLVELLTPIEFIQLFPIMKDFDGHKYGMKDYSYTRDYIDNLDQSKPIPDGLEFLMEYWNEDINKFNLKVMVNISDLRRYEGKQSIASEWTNANGIETHTKHKDSKGNEFTINSRGRTQKINKSVKKQSYLILVK